MARAGLYVHIPFCASLCRYCTFPRAVAAPGEVQRYVTALEREILGTAPQAAAGLAGADTVYFGGGTPSLVEPDDAARLVGACRDTFAVPPDAEVTLEANPETVDESRLAAFRQAGVTRLSLGVQSFADCDLERLGRIHTAARARAAVADARRAGFDNISLDLIMWLPEQTLDEWLESVEWLAALEPQHASLYMLELHAETPLGRLMESHRWRQAPDDTAAEMYLRGLERLDAAGYRQYEISNVARPGRESRHNLKYWTDGDWLGLGAAAHSTVAGVRWKNVSDTAEYIDRIEAGARPATDRHVLTRRRRFEDAMMMGLRLAAGVDLPLMARRYGVDVWEAYGRRLEPFIEAGLLVREAGRLRLTRPGMLLANDVISTFVGTDSTVE